MAGTGAPKTSIYVSNLHQELTKEQIENFFIPFGEIVEVSLQQQEDAPTLNTGSALIEFEEQGDAESAIDNMNDAELYHQIINVSFAKKSHAFEGLGSDVPLWEQEGFIQQYLGHGDAMQGLETENGKTESEAHEHSGGMGDLPVSVGPIAPSR